MIGIMSEECVLHCGCYPALADSASKLKRDRDALLSIIKEIIEDLEPDYESDISLIMLQNIQGKLKDIRAKVESES